MIWEYKTLTLPSSAERQSMLTEMGLNGWELVGFEQGLAYFKRPRTAEPETGPTEATITHTHSDLTKPDAPIQKPTPKKK